MGFRTQRLGVFNLAHAPSNFHFTLLSFVFLISISIGIWVVCDFVLISQLFFVLDCRRILKGIFGDAATLLMRATNRDLVSILVIPQ